MIISGNDKLCANYSINQVTGGNLFPWYVNSTIAASDFDFSECEKIVAFNFSFMHQRLKHIDKRNF